MKRMWSKNEVKGLSKEVIESGQVENAKPIYLHPIRFNIVGSLTGGITCRVTRGSIMIFNNSAEKIDTYSKLVTYLYNSGEAIDILCSVDFYDSNATYKGQILKVSAIETSLNVTATINGTDLIESNLANSEVTIVSDNVNKIN